MSQIDRLIVDFWTAKISRRDFLSKAAALGLSAGLVGEVLAGSLPKAAAGAVEPKRGGVLKVALDGEIVPTTWAATSSAASSSARAPHCWPA